jgi:Lipase (class 3)
MVFCLSFFAYLLVFFSSCVFSMEEDRFVGFDRADNSLVLRARASAMKSYEYINNERILSFEEVDNSNYIFRGSEGFVQLSGRSHHNLGVVSFYEKNKVFIAFHGSESIDDWISNFDSGSINVNFGGTRFLPSENNGWFGIDNIQGLVHRGFYAFVGSGFDNLIGILKKKQNKYLETEFVFTGHSLGGAAATIAAGMFFGRFREIFGELPAKNQVKILTFSAPCVGDKAFAESLGKIFSNNFIRFVANFDPVPSLNKIKIPILKGWKGVHSGVELTVLFLEQLENSLNNSNVLDWLKGVGGIFFNRLSGGNLTYLLFKDAGKVAVLSAHKVPSEEATERAFSDYKHHINVGLEGQEWSEGNNLEPGQVRYFDSVRNPIVRWINSKFGGF